MELKLGDRMRCYLRIGRIVRSIFACRQEKERFPTSWLFCCQNWISFERYRTFYIRERSYRTSDTIKARDRSIFFENFLKITSLKKICWSLIKAEISGHRPWFHTGYRILWDGATGQGKAKLNTTKRQIFKVGRRGVKNERYDRKNSDSHTRNDKNSSKNSQDLWNY